MSACLLLGRNDQNQTSASVRQSSCRKYSRAICLDILSFSNWNLFVIWILLFGAYPPKDLLGLVTRPEYLYK